MLSPGFRAGGALLGFATAVLVACGTAYVIIDVLHWRLLPPSVHLMSEFVVTVLFYIPAAFVLGAIHRQSGRTVAKRCLMPLFDRKDKSRYATFTRRTLMMAGRHGRRFRGAGRPALPASDPATAIST